MSLFMACAVKRRRFPVGASPTRQPLQSEATGGPAATTAEAEHLIAEHAPDVALVDFHLRGGELSYSLIARLHEQGVPVIPVSGSSESLSGLPVEVATILEEPVSEAQLLASLRPLLTQKEPR
jgi:DNA-binding response OmpR family regulator